MPNSWTAKIILIVSLAALVGILMGCAEENKVITEAPGGTITATDGCIGCHTDEAMLQATAEPDDGPPPSSGEG